MGRIKKVYNTTYKLYNISKKAEPGRRVPGRRRANMEKVYKIEAGDIIRHGSGDGWIRVDGFNGEIFDVTDMDLMPGDTFADVGRTYLMTMQYMLRCIKLETGMEYDRAEFIDKAYRVKPEYWSLWGSDTDENTVIPYGWAVQLAHEWGKSVYAIFDQLEEIR